MEKVKSKSKGRPKKFNRTSRGLNSYAQASHMTGHSIENMKLWKRNGCPAFRNGMIYTDELEQWLKGEGIDPSTPPPEGDEGNDERPIRGTPEEVNRERIKKMRKEQRKLDREHEVQIGLLVKMDEVKKDIASVVDQLTGILKKTLDRQTFNAVAKQFAQVDFKGLASNE